MTADPLKALFHPFESGALSIPDGARMLFAGGQFCPGLSHLRNCRVTAQQYFRPHARALQEAGIEVVTEIPDEKSFDAVLVHTPRQREETLFVLAAALRALKPGGLLICAAANDAGGRRLRDDLAGLGVQHQTDSKYKSRIVWAHVSGQADLSAPLRAGAPQTVLEGRYVSRPGLFCWDRIDTGSAQLAAVLPALAGQGADFGCGYGFLSGHVMRHSPDAVLTCIDADARAVECCRLTLEKDSYKARYLWADITDAREDLPRGLDWIVMNPPFHEGKAALPRIGGSFIARAAETLRPGGHLWLVANAGLPYEKILDAHFRESVKLAEGNGYKIFWAEA